MADLSTRVEYRGGTGGTYRQRLCAKLPPRVANGVGLVFYKDQHYVV
jgi:hypothetical protein